MLTIDDSASVQPFAQRNLHYVKEQFGQIEEKTELPQDYIALEKRIEALKAVHTKLLAVTSQYTHEAYDYPPNIRESFTDLSRTVGEKVKLLSTASSAAEAQQAFTAPPSTKPQPKTFNHAIARASLAGSQQLVMSEDAGTQDPLAQALERYAIAQEKVGEARLDQDHKIQQRFLTGWSTTLNTNLGYAAKARKAVESARLNLDATKARLRAKVGDNEANMNDAQRAELEKAEDDFVNQTEEAAGVMRNVLDTPEPLKNLAELIAAQLEFHKRSQEILTELAPEIDNLQVEQEVSDA